MKIYTIEKKMSGTGSIHDIKSDQYDREIRFPNGKKYAVVLAAYYGGKGYSVHRSERLTIMAATKTKDYSHEIIDSEGTRYTVAYDRLEKY